MPLQGEAHPDGVMTLVRDAGVLLCHLPAVRQTCLAIYTTVGVGSVDLLVACVEYLL